MAKNDQSADDFLRALERKSGGSIEWKTYAFYLGKTGDNTDTTGGLLYRVGDSLIFEDFESGRPMIRVFTKPKPYKKTRFFIPLAAITKIKPVAAGMAKKVIKGSRSIEQVEELSGFERFFFKRVEALISDEEDTYFFELYDRDGLYGQLRM